jgi:hypothetical protein
MQILINKTQTMVEIAEAELPQASKDFIFNYGLRQILNDCHSSIKRADFSDEKSFSEAVMEAVDAKLGAILSGDLHTRRASGESLDPVVRETVAIAKEELAILLKNKGLSKAKVSNYDEVLQSYVEKHVERLTKEAKTRIAAKAKKAAEVNLDDLMDLIETAPKVEQPIDF